MAYDFSENMIGSQKECEYSGKGEAFLNWESGLVSIFDTLKNTIFSCYNKNIKESSIYITGMILVRMSIKNHLKISKVTF